MHHPNHPRKHPNHSHDNNRDDREQVNVVVGVSEGLHDVVFEREFKLPPYASFAHVTLQSNPSQPSSR